MSEQFCDPILPKVERFMKRHGISDTAFGLMAAKDRNLVDQLRGGRELRHRTRAKILEAMAAYRSGGTSSVHSRS